MTPGFLWPLHCAVLFCIQILPFTLRAPGIAFVELECAIDNGRLRLAGWCMFSILAECTAS